MFEKALRLQLRFATGRGLLSVEDLWRLSLPELNELAIRYRKMIQEQEVSFLDEKTSDEKLELGFEIVKHIIKTLLEEKDARLEQASKAAKKQKLLELLATKQDAALAAKTEEELLAELEAL